MDAQSALSEHNRGAATSRGAGGQEHTPRHEADPADGVDWRNAHWAPVCRDDSSVNDSPFPCPSEHVAEKPVTSSNSNEESEAAAFALQPGREVFVSMDQRLQLAGDTIVRSPPKSSSAERALGASVPFPAAEGLVRSSSDAASMGSSLAPGSSTALKNYGQCPICERSFTGFRNEDINEHIDVCLNSSVLPADEWDV